MTKTSAKAKKDIKQLKSDVIDDSVDIAPVHQPDVDPEILKLIGARKPKKPKTEDIDYIADLEREDNLDFPADDE